ncbi:MAG: ABC transporter permease [Bacteroidota bacterium]
MIKYSLIGFIAELEKQKRNGTYTILFIFSLGVSICYFLLYIIGPESYVSTLGTNPWVNFINRNISLYSFIGFPILTILLSSQLISVENRASSWKLLFTTTFSKVQILIVKVLLINFLMIFSLLLFFATVASMGYILSLIHPEYEFLYFNADWNELISNLGLLFFSCLGVLGFHFFLSVAFRRQVISIVAGIILLIVGFLVSLLNPDYSDYIFYAYPSSFMDFGIGHVASQSTKEMMLKSTIYFLFFVTLSFRFLKRKL